MCVLVAISLHMPMSAAVEPAPSPSSDETLLNLLGNPVLQGPETIYVISSKAIECVNLMAGVSKFYPADEGGEMGEVREAAIGNCQARVSQLIEDKARNTGGYTLEDFETIEMRDRVLAAEAAAFITYRQVLSGDQMDQYRFVDSDFWIDQPVSWSIAPPS